MSCNIMSFNILSSTLSTNPFEFQSLYRDSDVYNTNLSLLFEAADIVFNPKSKARENKTRMRIKVKDFFPDESVLRNADIARYIAHLKSVNAVDPDRLADLRNLDVFEVVGLYDKSNKNGILADYALPAIDRKTKLKRFYEYKGKEDVSEKKTIIQSEGKEKDFMYALVDLMMRYVVKSYYSLLYFNKYLDVRVVRLNEDQLKRSLDILLAKIQNSATTLESFVYDVNEASWMAAFFEDYNRINTPMQKLDTILKTMGELKVDVATLIEITRDFYDKMIATDVLTKHNMDYFPKNHKFDKDSDFLTLTIYNASTVSNVSLFHKVDERIKIIKFNVDKVNTVHLGQCHLAAGDGFEEQRLKEVKDLLSTVTKSTENLYICGDMNEDLKKDEGVSKYLREFGFTVGDLERNRLQKETCDKMRSALQFQVNKMLKADVSTKDVILGYKKSISDKDYKITYLRISDHKMVSANIKL